MTVYNIEKETINGKHSWLLEYYSKAINPDNEEVIIGQELQTVIENLIKDLDNDIYIYNNDESELRIEFIEAFCKHTKSPFNGMPFILELWEKAVIEAFFSFKMFDTGFRRFKKLILLIGRKNGKSTFCAALCFSEFMIGLPGSVCVCSSNDDAQANLIFEEIANMREKFDPKGKRTHKNLRGIYNLKNDSQIIKLSEKTKNKEGRNIDFGVLDESHEMKTNVIAKSIEQSQSTKDEPIFINITTEGFTDDGYLDKELKYAREVIRGEREDYELLPWLYTMDSENEIFTSKKAWKKANPSLGKIKKYSYIERELRKAQASKADRIFTLSKDFNLKQNGIETWLLESDIKNDLTYNIEDFRNCIGLAGTDLSETIDLTSARIMIMKKGDSHKYFISHYFIPESKVAEAKPTDGVKGDGINYLQAARDGWITICPGNDVDYSMVAMWYISIYKKYGIRIFKEGHDKWNARSYVKEMDDYGIDNEKVEQNYENISTPMKLLEADLKSKFVNYNQNPVDIYCLKNMACSVDKYARIMPKKVLDKAANHIDGGVTMIICYAMLDRYKKEYMDIINR
ncbi:MAG: terminase large subunit [Clostridia bacterium]|jgi:phage terminase large subunit-like protein|nr:terminase large subunit [Clostridia bacterium]